MTEFPPVCCAECGAFILGDHMRVIEGGAILRWNGSHWEPAARTFCVHCGHSVALVPSIERNPAVVEHMAKMERVWNGQA